MRGPSKSPPKYRKHRPSGQAIVTLNGNDYYLGPHGTQTSKTEYDRLIGEWLANGRTMPEQNKAALSVSQVCAMTRTVGVRPCLRFTGSLDGGRMRSWYDH